MSLVEVIALLSLFKFAGDAVLGNVVTGTLKNIARELRKTFKDQQDLDAFERFERDPNDREAVTGFTTALLQLFKTNTDITALLAKDVAHLRELIEQHCTEQQRRIVETHISNSKNVLSQCNIESGTIVFVGDIVIQYFIFPEYEEIQKSIDEYNTQFAEKNKQIQLAEGALKSSLELERLRIDERRNEWIEKLKQFRSRVLSLAETFTKIPISTEKLERAKALFQQGKLTEAEAVWNYSELKTKVNELRDERAKSENRIKDIDVALLIKADEFLVLALLAGIRLGDGYFAKANQYYLDSLYAFEYFRNCFAYAYFLQIHNKFNCAQVYYEKILIDIGSGDSEPDVAMTFNNMGLIYAEQHVFGKALETYERALEIYEHLTQTQPTVYEPDVAMTLHNMGNVHRNSNDFDKAIEVYERALEMRERLAQAQPAVFEPDVATTRNSLGNVYADQHDYGKAVDAYNRALEIRERLAQAQPAVYEPDVAMVLNNLGLVYTDQHVFGMAIVAYKRALEIYKRLAQAQPDVYESIVAAILNNLGLLYSDLRELGKATEAYERALEVRERLSQTQPAVYEPDVAMTLNNLGNVYAYQNDYSKAIETYERALEIYERWTQAQPTTYEPISAMTLSNMGNIYRNSKDYDKAFGAYERALEIYERFAQAQPTIYEPDLARTCAGISILYTTGQPEKDPALDFASYALLIGLNYFKSMPAVQQYVESALSVFKHWGVDPDEYLAQMQSDMENRDDK